MKRNIDFSRGLLIKAHNDMKVVAIGVEHDAPLDVMCFHLQQAAEKLIKALLASKNVNYPLTHDLDVLIEHALPLFPELVDFREPLLSFGPYAVEMRYDDEIYPEDDEVAEGQKTVLALAKIVERLVSGVR